MNEPTKKQVEALREFLHEAVVPLIEDVLVKKLGQAMSYAKEQYKEPKREWLSLTSEELASIVVEHAGFPTRQLAAIEAALRKLNHG